MADPTITYYEDQEMIEKCGHNFKLLTGVLTFTTYTTGGVGFDLRQQLPIKIHQVIIEPKSGYIPVYAYSTTTAAGKIVIYNALATEVTSSADLSTVLADCRFTAIGK